MVKIGSQFREKLEETEFKLISLSGDNEEAILQDKISGQCEVWGLKDDFAGYTIEILGKGYEFYREIRN